MINDEQLIQRALQGDPDAFGELVRKYQDRLFNTILQMAGTHEEAEDVVQDAFVQAYVKLQSFQQKSAFFTWLYRIAFNCFVNRRRRKHVEASVENDREKTGSEPLDPGDGPDEHFERKEQASQVQLALAQLNEVYRAIIILREMEGCSYEAIAEILKLPSGTVRSRLFRARLQMRDLLKETLQEPTTE